MAAPVASFLVSFVVTSLSLRCLRPVVYGMDKIKKYLEERSQSIYYGSTAYEFLISLLGRG